MLITAPVATPVVFVPPSTTINVDSVSFDLNAHTYTVSYRDGAATVQRTVTGNIPGALLTSIESALKTAIEAHEGWTAGSSTLTTP